MNPLLLIIITFFQLFFSCSERKSSHSLRVIATPVPHAEILEFAAAQLTEEGIELEIILTDDYQLGNRALIDGDVDANFFQHLPFFKKQCEQFNYKIQPLVAVHIEPMGLYSKKNVSLTQITGKSRIAIPNDPSNESRALLLLQEAKLITLNPDSGLDATVWDILANPRKLKFLEIDAAMLPRALDDVSLAAINANYALSSGLDPIDDSLLLESLSSPFVNIVAIREGEMHRPELQALSRILTSEKVRSFIKARYRGTLHPTTP